MAIQAWGLRKLYRLYSSPRYRLLDVLGLLWRNRGHYTERAAVNGIDLEIRRGEKVAIIGRNGAGKSTLLKLITKVIEPSSGTIHVAGRTQALLQLGTGFHPDFTGRQNVRSYLSQMGLSGETLNSKVRDVVEFAEIEEYIDQPMKSYSTGMISRLMFSSSTVIDPDLLVIDEILSVGDAYFAKKSFDKIQQLSNNGSTLLMVTHDLYAASHICERFIWIDGGCVLMDGSATEVIKRYESSVRDQQEASLRRHNFAVISSNLKKNDIAPIMGHFICGGNHTPGADLPLSSLSVMHEGTVAAHFSIGEDGRGWSVITDGAASDWSDPVERDGRIVRNFKAWGSIYHRAAFALEARGLAETIHDGAEVAVEYLDSTAVPVWLEIFTSAGRARYRMALGNTGDQTWKTVTAPLTGATELLPAAQSFNRYGTQRLAITDVKFVGDDGADKFMYRVGDNMEIQLTYKIFDRNFCQKPIVHVSFLKGGTVRTHRYVLDSAEFSWEKRPEGVVSVSVSPLLLGPGQYHVNVTVMSENGYDGVLGFHTVNEDFLDMHSRAYLINVEDTGNLLVDDVIFVHPAEWKKDGVVVARGGYSIRGPDVTQESTGDGEISAS